MSIASAERRRISFCGLLRTPQGSVILVSIENSLTSPQAAPKVPTNPNYSRFVQREEEGAGVEHDLLNARYYDDIQGQFVSQDPVFLAMGSPHQLQQIGNQDQNDLLANPQSLNSYGYSDDNPIINKDPDGKYWELSLSGTYDGLSGSTGFDISSQGFNFFASGGFGVGVGSAVSLTYTPGDVTHNIGTEDSIGGDAAYIVGGGASKNGQYNHNTKVLNNPSDHYSLEIGFGADAYARRTLSYPIFGGNDSIPITLPIGNGLSNSTPNYLSIIFRGMYTPPSFSVGQSAAGTYTFNGGVNAYGQTYEQVFSQQ
jgi:hypothetical protein